MPENLELDLILGLFNNYIDMSEDSSIKDVVLNMLDEMLEILTLAGDESCSLAAREARIKETIKTTDVISGEIDINKSENVLVETNNWITYKLRSLKELLDPGTGFSQSKGSAEKYDEFLAKVAEVNPQLLYERVIGLVDEITVEAKRLDKIHKRNAIREGKGEKAIGESWLIFNLRNLRKLIIAHFLKKELNDV